MAEAEKVMVGCPECGTMIPANKDGSLRTHKLSDSSYCPGGRQPKPSFSSLEDKAKWLVSEGRVQVVSAQPGAVEVRVFGSDPEPYLVKYSGAAWFCDCPARVIDCAHVLAARLVVDSTPAAEIFNPEDPEDVFKVFEGL